jgi:hypothetical protein
MHKIIRVLKRLGDVPNSVENAKADVASISLRGISEVVNCRSGGLTATVVLKGGLEYRQMLVGLEAPEALFGVNSTLGSLSPGLMVMGGVSLMSDVSF